MGSISQIRSSRNQAVAKIQSGTQTHRIVSAAWLVLRAHPTQHPLTVPLESPHPTQLPMRLARICCAIAVALTLVCRQDTASAAPPMSELVRAELIAEPAAVAAGQPFWAGIRLRIK